MGKVSVIIPAFNAMRYLPETLASVLNQTLTDIEVLLIDDGSTDETFAWASGLEDPRVRVIHQPNSGQSVARNRGIQEARADYLAFIDADDLWDPSKLERQFHYLQEHPEFGVVDVGTRFVNENGQALGKVTIPSFREDVWQQLLVNNPISCASTVMIRRSVFDRVGGFDPEVGKYFVDDWDLWIRIAACYSFGVIDQVLVSYRQHSSNSSKNLRRMVDGSAATIEKNFRDVDRSIQPLKIESYRLVYLHYASTALDRQDVKLAHDLYQEAIQKYPEFRRETGFIRLARVIQIRRVLGSLGLSAYYQLRSGWIRLKGILGMSKLVTTGISLR